MDNFVVARRCDFMLSSGYEYCKGYNIYSGSMWTIYSQEALKMTFSQAENLISTFKIFSVYKFEIRKIMPNDVTKSHKVEESDKQSSYFIGGKL